MTDLSSPVCARCVISPTFPRAKIGDDGLCQDCRRAPSLEELRLRRRRLSYEIQALLQATRGRRYECLVALSGGKDSSYVLSQLVQKHGLRCLALTIDNTFLSDTAMRNCKAVTSALDTDLLILRPAAGFMHRVYRASLSATSLHSPSAIKRGSSLCNSCINLINTSALNTALEKEIPLIAGGYLAGQTPRDAAVVKLELATGHIARTATVKQFEEHLGPESLSYFQLDPVLVERSSLDHLHLLNPLVASPQTEESIYSTVEEFGWRKPIDTGVTSTNCRLNDLGVYTHYQKHGFHPYTAEIAEQVRFGFMSREEGLQRLHNVPTLEQVTGLAEELGVSLEQR